MAVLAWLWDLGMDRKDQNKVDIYLHSLVIFMILLWVFLNNQISGYGGVAGVPNGQGAKHNGK